MIGLLSDLPQLYNEHLVVVGEALLDWMPNLHLIAESLASRTNLRCSPLTAGIPACLSKCIFRPRALVMS